LKLHPTKTDFKGKHALELLGIVVDTRRQLYLLSPSKLANISQAARLLRLKAIRHKRRCGLRDIQRRLFIPSDAEPTSINQRELLAATFGLKTFLPVANQQRVQLLSDSQVALAVISNWTCRSPRDMVLLRILRRLCEENGISLGLQYIPSVLNI
jgi:hypothetical protein